MIAGINDGIHLGLSCAFEVTAVEGVRDPGTASVPTAILSEISLTSGEHSGDNDCDFI